MKSIRFYFRLLTTFIVRLKKIIFLGFLLGILAFFFLPRLISLLPPRQETQTIGLVGRYTLENIPSETINSVSQGLTQVEKDGTPRPALAREWTIENEGKTYTFRLKDNLFWHDGTKVKAQDINYNFKDVTLEVLDEKTIRFVLREPFSPFPVIVSRPIFKKGFVGVGPYQVKKITRQGQFIESIYLKSLAQGKPNLTYRFYPTESAAKTGFKLGEVRVLENIVDPTGFEEWKNSKITPGVRFDQYTALFFNTSQGYPEDKNFRQALAYAIPKEKGDKRALGPLSPNSWAYNIDVKPYEYNLELAKSLLGKTKEKEISIKLTTVSSLLPEAEKIKKSWENLGIKTEIQNLRSPDEPIETLLAIQEIPIDPDQYSLWHSTQTASNITNFKSPRIDKLLEDGRKTQDQEKRKKNYFDFQRFLVEEVPTIFLYHPITYEISRQ